MHTHTLSLSHTHTHTYTHAHCLLISHVCTDALLYWRTGLGRICLNEISTFTGVVTAHAYTHAHQHQLPIETLMRVVARESLSQRACSVRYIYLHREADVLRYNLYNFSIPHCDKLNNKRIFYFNTLVRNSLLHSVTPFITLRVVRRTSL